MKRISFFFAVAVLLGAWAQPLAWSDAETKEQGGAMSSKQKIVPCLWFHNQAEEAVRFYSSIFPDAKVLSESRQGPKGPLVSAKFRLAGQEFLAINGGPKNAFTEAVSLLVNCGSQEEVDDLWAKLTAGGGEPGRCGWLKDRFGVSWQVIPTVLGEMLSDKDPEKAKRAVEAMLQMGKIDIRRLEQAVAGR